MKLTDRVVLVLFCVCSRPFLIQIVPSSSNGVDAVNFRRMEESNSLHLESQSAHIKAVAGAGVPQTPGTPGVDYGMEAAADADLFGAFSSITLHHDGDN